MSKNNSGIPEILQIKGYKYRAQMLIGAVIILLIILLIIISIINGIASLFKAKPTDSDTSTDTEATVSQAVQSVPTESAVVSSVVQATDTSSDTQTEKNHWNRPYRVSISGGTQYLPSDCVYGMRIAFPSSTGYLSLMIIGCDTNNQSSIWINTLNGGAWTGWRKVSTTSA